MTQEEYLKAFKRDVKRAKASVKKWKAETEKDHTPDIESTEKRIAALEREIKLIEAGEWRRI